jgi:PAS domain S-box-containing protein
MIDPAGLPEWSHFIIQSMADGVITVDGRMRITDLNRAAEKLSGFNRDEALDRFCGEILHSSMCGRECPLKLAMNGGEPISREAVLTNRLGQKIQVMLTASALRDDEGNLLGGVETFRDIAPFKLMENERRQLAGMFAHDLKGPVVGVAGLLNRLLQGKSGPLSEPQMAVLQTISQEIRRLEKLITNFLDFVRLDLHILKPLTSAIQVEKECQEVMNRYQTLAEAKNVNLVAEFPQEIIILQADPVLFQRALGNLLENAIKYSPPQTRVTLKVLDTGRDIKFSSIFSIGAKARGRRAVSALVWPLLSASSTLIKAISGWKALRIREQPFISPCRKPSPSREVHPSCSSASLPPGAGSLC